MPNLLDVLRRATTDASKIPPGALTAKGWAKRWKMSEDKAKELLNAGVRDGLVKTKVFRIQTPAGLRTSPHYWEAKSAPKPSSRQA